MKYLMLVLFFLIVPTVSAVEIKITYQVKSKYVVVENDRLHTSNLLTKYARQRVLVAGNTYTLWSTFVELAGQICEEENYPCSVLLGQAALESGRGTSQYAVTRNNFFGIGAYDADPDQAFTFGDIENGIREYINLIKNYYPLAYENKDNPYKMIAIIKNVYGYATDPDYVPKVTSMPEFINNL